MNQAMCSTTASSSCVRERRLVDGRPNLTSRQFHLSVFARVPCRYRSGWLIRRATT